MARVVVVGGGFAGTATAARLAKLGHDVTLLETLGRLGGAVGFVEQDGFRWDSGPTSTALPAVLRDLFRKSGRPLERELDLVPQEPMREHRFVDGSSVAMPSGSRSAQQEAVDAGLGAGLGQQWVDYTHEFADAWDLLRRGYLERPYLPEQVDPGVRSLLTSRLTLQKLVAKAFKDERLRQVALHHVVLDGHDPRNVPAWVGMLSYV
jgi:UDP-galactopyranose mutase